MVVGINSHIRYPEEKRTGNGYAYSDPWHFTRSRCDEQNSDYDFCSFVTFYIPCIATIAVLIQELGKKRQGL
jgi:Fe2+ transport system protein B